MCGELLNRRAGNDERTRGEHPPGANGKLCVGRMSAQILSPRVFAGEGCSAPAAPATPSMGVPMAAVRIWRERKLHRAVYFVFCRARALLDGGKLKGRRVSYTGSTTTRHKRYGA